MKKQSGFTLIELMISSLIGLVVMAGLMNLFITTNRSVSLSGALSQNQETGRFAMEYMSNFIRQAGYKDDFTSNNVPALLVPSGKTAETLITCANAPQSEACAVNNPNDARGDKLSIPFLVNAGDTKRSCSGRLVGDPNTKKIYVNVFWVSNEAATMRELRCRTYDHTNNNWFDVAVTIINNVELFEFQVGLANNPTDKYTARYVSVDTMKADNALEYLRSIRIAILTTSQDSSDTNKIQTKKKKRTYSLLDAPYLEITDGSLRNIFSNTIELPNLIESASEN